MDNPGEILLLCRLCLVKDQVNIPIFEEQGDIRQIFLKISSCLPIKVSRDDQLPKKICDGCSNKLDLLYEFWNTSANAEKTLLSWLGQAGVKDADETINAVAQQIAKPAETQVKEETETLEDGHVNSQNQDNFEPQSFDEGTKDEDEAPPPKRARRSAAVKAQINITPESDDDDDLDSAEPMTKMEGESDESDGEEKDPSYAEVPGTSADDQAGPSGVGKDGAEAPEQKIDVDKIESEKDTENSPGKVGNVKNNIDIKDEDMIIEDEPTPPENPVNIDPKNIKIPCFKCNLVFPMDEFLSHQATHTEMAVETQPVFTEVKCTECGMSFDTVENLVNHMKVLHFSMWGLWSQYYNWAQMDQYGYSYTQIAQQDSSEYFDPTSYNVKRRWASTREPSGHHHRRRSRSHSPHRGRKHSFSPERTHCGRGRHHSRHNDHGHRHSRSGHHHGHHGHHGGFLRHLKRKLRGRSRRRSSSREVHLLEEPCREERHHSRRRTPSQGRSNERSRRSISRRRSRNESPIVLLDSDDENTSHSRHSNDPLEEWIVADSWGS